MKSFTLNATKKLHSDIILLSGALSKLESLGVLDDVRRESKHLLITDENIEKLYLDSVLSTLHRMGLKILPIVVPPSESSKDLETFGVITHKALDYGFDKYSVVFSLGGGVVNNLAGFLASTLYRGIGLIHFPTSLLAQLDAAIDFKQAINFQHGKNLLGSYYPASKIIVDPTVLSTLDVRFIKDGLAEAVKHALCQDIAFYSFLCSNAEEITDQEVLYKIVQRTIELKLDLMGDDLESDHDETIKQYGHAVGHAVEHLSDGDIYHGEAISIGMCVSAEIALLLGVSDKKTLELHYDIFRLIGLPTSIPIEYSSEQIWNKMKYDKHSLDGRVYTGLVRAIGLMAETHNGDFGHYIDENIIMQAIENNRKWLDK